MDSEINQRVALICQVIIAGILTAGALYWLEPVMVPLVLAIMLTYMLAPVVDLLVCRLRFPRWLAVIMALGLAGLCLFLVGGMISNSVQALGNNATAYEQHIRESGASVIRWMEYKEIDIETENLEQHLEELPLASLLAGATNTIVDLISNTFLIMIFVIYLLQGRDPSHESGPIAARIEARIKRYLSIKLVLSMGTGIATGVILSLLEVELAMVFGVLAFILNFIPNVGSIIATLLPIPMVLVSPDASATTLILALALPGSVQLVVGNVIEPKMLGDSLELHPITVLLSLIFWGMLWGLPGMLLAAPITAVLKILSENLEVTAPVARLLAGDISGKQAAAVKLEATSPPVEDTEPLTPPAESSAPSSDEDSALPESEPTPPEAANDSS